MDEIHELTPCQISGHRFVDGFCPDCGENESDLTLRASPNVQIDDLGNLAERPHTPHFNENDCGGVFDGHGVVSDADPGL